MDKIIRFAIAIIMALFGFSMIVLAAQTSLDPQLPAHGWFLVSSIALGGCMLIALAASVFFE